MKVSQGGLRELPPAEDELEISLFGPGFGEAIAVHLGLGEWLLADSCVDRTRGTLPVLEYFDRLGVAADRAVRRIVVSHWDEDHVLGLSRLISTCSQARLVLSAAMRDEDFLAYVRGTGASPLATSARTREMHEALAVIDGRGYPQNSPIEAIQDRMIYERENGPIVGVRVLAPSDKLVQAATQRLARLMIERSLLPRRLPRVNPNDTSVVIWVRVGAANALLGADLESRGNMESVGWRAVVQASPSGKAHIFKVPHHGSADSHEPEVWEQLLVKDPVAILAPWSLGGASLPTQDDVERLCALTPHVYLASKQRRSSPTRDRAVERTLRERDRPLKVAEWEVGHVQVRYSAFGEGPIYVGLGGAAARGCL